MKPIITCLNIVNKDFDKLCDMAVKMHSFTDPKLTSFEVIKALTDDVCMRIDFTAFGVYEYNTMVGCLYGYRISKEVFHIDGLYCLKNSLALKELIAYTRKELKDAGYTKFTAQTENPSVVKIFKSVKSDINKKTITICRGEL